ncbi:MAG: DedA family protein [Desulfobulbus sp.]|nr:DedA family protein [Desulfobulbus sp.]
MFHQCVVWLSETVGQWGYPGIVLLMALESSFFPFPSEVVIPPAAYLAASGNMNLSMVILSGTAGSLLGALFNYWLAVQFGLPFLERYGRYLLISPHTLEKSHLFFERHGHISTFIGRLIPGIRQYISLPAGVARMGLATFCGATALGAGIWVMVLAGLGFWFGRNEQMVLHNLRWVSLGLVFVCSMLALLYWLKQKQRI